MLADVRMDGVTFGRVGESGTFARIGPSGAVTLCYLVRRAPIWLEIESPSLEHSTVELVPGTIVGLSGLTPHWFKSQRNVSVTRAHPLNLRRFDEPFEQCDVELLVGHAPLEVLAFSNLLVREIIIPPGAPDQISRRIWRAVEQIEDELSAPDPFGGTAAVVRRYSEVVLLNIARFVTAKADGAAIGGLAAVQDVRLMRALAAAARDPLADWTVEGLAEIAGMSRTAFSQTFHALTGMTPLQCVIDMRLRLASVELAHTEKPLEQVAAEVGYGSAAAFIRAFQRRYGQTPGRWRDDRAVKHGGGAATIDQ